MRGATDETDPTTRTEGTPFIPSEDWIDAFEKQSSAPGFEQKLKRFARMRANMVAHAGRRIDELYVRELVQDAIEDTLEGILAWHPERVTLDKHLYDSIRSRTRHDYVQALNFPHHSFDAASASPSLMADVESSLHATGPATASADVRSAAERALTELRRQAANDTDVLRLLDAYVAEAVKKVDVMRVSSLTSKRYEAARKRLQRLVLHLPTEVREAVRA